MRARAQISCWIISSGDGRFKCAQKVIYTQSAATQTQNSRCYAYAHTLIEAGQSALDDELHPKKWEKLRMGTDLNVSHQYVGNLFKFLFQWAESTFQHDMNRGSGNICSSLELFLEIGCLLLSISPFFNNVLEPLLLSWKMYWLNTVWKN